MHRIQCRKARHYLLVTIQFHYSAYPCCRYCLDYRTTGCRRYLEGINKCQYKKMSWTRRIQVPGSWFSDSLYSFCRGIIKVITSKMERLSLHPMVLDLRQFVLGFVDLWQTSCLELLLFDRCIFSQSLKILRCSAKSAGMSFFWGTL